MGAGPAALASAEIAVPEMRCPEGVEEMEDIINWEDVEPGKDIIIQTVNVNGVPVEIVGPIRLKRGDNIRIEFVSDDKLHFVITSDEANP